MIYFSKNNIIKDNPILFIAMSYIEKKYKNKILEIFKDLSILDNDVLELFNHKSIQYTEKIAKLCALCNKQINLILRKYYPEIKQMEDKLQIKSNLKFYFDLLDKLTDFVRKVENFQKIDEKYYDAIIEFIREKDLLISGKYKAICTQELTAFYDQSTRDNLERIIAEKFERKNREFFTMGPLEEEIKKIAKIAGADEVAILKDEEMVKRINFIDNPRTIIHYTVYSEDEEKLKKVGAELKAYLISKGYEAIAFLVDLKDIPTERQFLTGSIITNADLFSDKDNN